MRSRDGRAACALTALALLLTTDCRTTPPRENVNPAGRGGGVTGAVPSSAGTAGPSPGGPATPGFDKNALLAAIADCATGRYRAFQEAAHALRVAAPADARAAWQKAMDEWQEAEVFGFGPAAASNNPGGMDLRDQIHAWPLFNRCRVDEVTVDGSYATPAFATSLVSARSLTAWEYLGFYEGVDNGCSTFSVINSSGSWSAIGVDGLRSRKERFAAAIADDVATRADALVAAWGPFRDELVNAGAGSKTFATHQNAFDAINEGLFHIESSLKDLKLARPLGLTECGATDCARTVESPWARRSKENIQRNLAGFRRLFQGCGANNEGLAFDDWLVAAGAGDLAIRMLAALTNAETVAAALDGSLEDALATSPAKVQSLYDAVKALTDLLKTELVTVLNLELPKATEGDND